VSRKKANVAELTHLHMASVLLMGSGRPRMPTGCPNNIQGYVSQIPQPRIAADIVIPCVRVSVRYHDITTGTPPVRRTSPALQCGPNGLNGQCHQMLPGLSVYRAYNVCYFVMQVPKKVKHNIHSCRPTVQTLLECFIRINLIFFYTQISVQ
jgi:hypothetical protein